jgi:hypothetical protein
MALMQGRSGAEYVELALDASGHVQVDVVSAPAADTELAAAVALNGTILKSVSAPVVGAALLVSDNTNLIQPLGDAANGLDVDVTRLPALEATTPTEYNVTLTNANTEYYQALPANTRRLCFRCRTGVVCRYAWVTGKVAGSTAPYQTLQASSEYAVDGVKLASSTLYFASATAGAVIELEVWA